MNKKKAASMLGRIGGTARTEAKVAAAKTNGAKGGRPPHLDLTREQKTILTELVSKDRARLVRNQEQDPAFDWQKFVDDRDALLSRLRHETYKVSIPKTDLRGLIQLLAERIAVEERAGNKTYSNPALDSILLKLHKVAEYIDELISPPGPSIFQHYLKESRGRFPI